MLLTSEHRSLSYKQVSNPSISFPTHTNGERSQHTCRLCPSRNPMDMLPSSHALRPRCATRCAHIHTNQSSKPTNQSRPSDHTTQILPITNPAQPRLTNRKSRHPTRPWRSSHVRVHRRADPVRARSRHEHVIPR